MPEVIDDQLARLRLAAQMSNITLQVLPFRAGTQEGMSGSFMILGFAHEADQDVIFVELPRDNSISTTKITFVVTRACSSVFRPERSAVRSRPLSWQSSRERGISTT